MSDLKTGMDFWGQVWKRVWEMAFFGLKLGLDFEMRAAHPHQKLQEVPPLPGVDITKLPCYARRRSTTETFTLYSFVHCHVY